MKDFQGYGFNKSHGVAYAHTTYFMAFFKYNHPVNFFLNSLNLENDPKKRILLVLDAISNGIKVVPPKEDKLSLDFYLESGTIVFGIKAMKNLGHTFYNKVRNGLQLSEIELFNYKTAITDYKNWRTAMKHYGLTFDDFNNRDNLHHQFFHYLYRDHNQVDLRVVHAKLFYGPIEYDNKYVHGSRGDFILKVTDGS